MIKLYVVIILFAINAPMFANCQSTTSASTQIKIDSLKQAILENGDSKMVIESLRLLSQMYFTGYYQLDSAKKYATLLQDVSTRHKDKRGIALSKYYLGRVADGKGDFTTAINYLSRFLESDIVSKDSLLLASGLYSMANVYIHQGDLEQALNYQLQVLRLDEASGDSSNIGLSLNNLGIIMKELNRDDKAIEYLERTKAIFENLGNEANVAMALSNLGGLYSGKGDNAKALRTFQRSLAIYKDLHHERGIALALEHIGNVQGKTGDYTQAIENHQQSLAIKQNLGLKKEIAESFHQLAIVYRALGNTDSARFYFNRGLQTAQEIGDKKGIRRAYQALSELEAANSDYKKAYEYSLDYHDISDSILNESIAGRISQLETKYEVEKKETEISNLRSEQQLHRRLSQTLSWALLATAVIAILVIVFLFYRSRFNKRLFQIEQVQTRRVEHAYTLLKDTQSQLIQSEKMASLGEMTAGIAHEIQNPLNFVNNFSEVSNELMDELMDELNTGDIEEAKAIGSDIKQNLEKINHHGKRADAIVKSMLQHSRKSSGQKEATDINALCDEYLRLAYHGLRAKNKSLNAEETGFNASYETHFDESIGKINIVPQDLGRVILNLINNAFYAVNEKAKTAGEQFKPLVEVRTKKTNTHVEIHVKDNGYGIPDDIKEKIFQPFFTTKPTGQGTGLGLSLSYDIVKAHGGELSVETVKDQFTSFTITLPL